MRSPVLAAVVFATASAFASTALAATDELTGKTAAFAITMGSAVVSKGKMKFGEGHVNVQDDAAGGGETEYSLSGSKLCIGPADGAVCYEYAPLEAGKPAKLKAIGEDAFIELTLEG